MDSQLSREWALGHFDPWDRRITRSNVWNLYREMRNHAAAVYSEAHGGFWSIVRYQDIKEAAKDFKVFSSAGGTTIGEHTDPNTPPKAPIEYDPPEHTRLRMAMQGPFLLKSTQAFTSGIRSCVIELLEKIASEGKFDIVHDLAEPVPQEVLAKILGFDKETTVLNRAHVLAVVNSDFASKPPAWRAFQEFLRVQIRQRQNDPGDDFFSHLCIDEFDGERFSERDLIAMLAAFALAGHHTAINGISSAVRNLADPAVKKAYLQDPSLSARIIDETLRLDPPIHLEARTTTETVEVDGVTIPANSKVALIYGSGNHDEREFQDPEIFDFKRPTIHHLSFGHGIHTCVGMHLAKLEMAVVMEEIIKKFPNYRVVGPSIDTGMIYGHHMGWESIPAEVG